MARIRTIKPEFWEDDVIGCLGRDARLLFIATWNLADDEGLLRWSAAYLKSSAFIYDDDIDVKRVERLMAEVTAAQLVHAYHAGKAQQPFAYVVGFHKHQKINRPSPSRLPAPPLHSIATVEMYAGRDKWKCHLCGGRIQLTEHGSQEEFLISLDHVSPVSSGGSDYPTNIRAAHRSCNKGRGNRSIEQYRELIIAGKTVAQERFPDLFSELLSAAGSDAPSTASPPEGKGSGAGAEESPKAPKGAVRPNDFDRWYLGTGETDYAGYPHKVAVDAAIRAWEKRRKAGTLPSVEILIAATRAYVAKKPSDVAWANPSTWLTGGRWQDEPALIAAPGSVTAPKPARTDADWVSAIETWQRTGNWPGGNWGPEPGYTGCEVPKGLIARFNLDGLSIPDYRKSA